MNEQSSSSQQSELALMHLKFGDGDVDGLRNIVEGDVVVFGADGYHKARQGFVKNYQAFPQIIVYCQVDDDVREAIQFAKDFKLMPVCRAGGHNTAGYAVNDEMIIDVSRINHIKVDREKKRATVGAGVTFGRLNAVLNRYGLHVPGGGCDEVAVAGFMLGGGYGYTSMMFGMNCDSVVEARVALADGRIVTASEKSEQDLFWALRGGTGNNFGVLLEVTYELHELGELSGFGIRWRLGFDEEGAERIGNVLHRLQKYFTGPKAPPELGHQSTLNFIDDQPYLVLRGIYNGSPEDGARVIEPLLKTDGAEQDIDWRRGTYLDLNGNLNGDPMVPDVVIGYTRTQADSRYVEKPLEAREWAELARYFQGSPNRGNFVGLEAYGCKISEVKPSATAFVHRHASFDVYIWVFWQDETEERKSLKFLEEFRGVMDRLGSSHAYQNYPNRANSEYHEMYWGENLRKLQDIKRHYDSYNLFSYGQSVL